MIEGRKIFPSERSILLELVILPAKSLFAGVAAWVPTTSAGDHRVRALSCFFYLENINLDSYVIPPEQTTLKSAGEIQQFLLQVFRGLTDTSGFLLPLRSIEEEERNEQEAFGNI